MTGKVREVKSIREVAQGGARGHIKSTMEKVEEKHPREWVPVDSPQVTAGEGRLGKRASVEDSVAKVGVQLKSIRRAGGMVPGRKAHHTGGCRRREEELNVVGWYGGIDGSAVVRQHHHVRNPVSAHLSPVWTFRL